MNNDKLAELLTKIVKLCRVHHTEVLVLKQSCQHNLKKKLLIHLYLQELSWKERFDRKEGFCQNENEIPYWSWT